VNQVTAVAEREMRSWSAYVLHGLYVTLYAPFKYLSFPFANYVRYGILRLFRADLRTAAIADGVMIWFPWRVAIGRDSTLNQGVIVDGFGGVRIGDGVRIAAYSCINTADHDFTDRTIPIFKQGFLVSGVDIGDDVWIGAGVKINKGVRIGAHSVIGAGSVVTKDIPGDSVAAGVPCRVLRSRAAPSVPVTKNVEC
jgi:acetyltransferase-like isoleucine patch superfamily enzyme